MQATCTTAEVASLTKSPPCGAEPCRSGQSPDRPPLHGPTSQGGSASASCSAAHRTRHAHESGCPGLICRTPLEIVLAGSCPSQMTTRPLKTRSWRRDMTSPPHRQRADGDGTAAETRPTAHAQARGPAGDVTRCSPARRALPLRAQVATLERDSSARGRAETRQMWIVDMKGKMRCCRTEPS